MTQPIKFTEASLSIFFARLFFLHKITAKGSINQQQIQVLNATFRLKLDVLLSNLTTFGSFFQTKPSSLPSYCGLLLFLSYFLAIWPSE
jgi:hypothetical protein